MRKRRAGRLVPVSRGRLGSESCVPVSRGRLGSGRFARATLVRRGGPRGGIWFGFAIGGRAGQINQ
eukprot:1221853-Lingulodinium_polyedra.AAC.1